MRVTATLLGCFLFPAVAHTQETPVQVQAAPLPDIRTLMLEVEANQKKFEALANDYTYRVHLDRTELNSNGSVKKHEVIDSESFTIDGVRVNKRILMNGKPLTPDEASKENERLDKTVADAKKNREKLEDKDRASNAQGREILTASRILELGEFSNLHAGEFAGRPMWIADYAGDPKAKTNSEFEKAFRDLVGTVWIDQHDHVLVAAKGHFLKDFKIGFGLVVNIRKDSEFSFHAIKVGDTWLRQEIDGSGNMSYLLFGGFNGSIHIVTSNYKRYRANATIRPNNNVVDENGKPLPVDPVQPATTP
jgi:hypothetical protein